MSDPEYPAACRRHEAEFARGAFLKRIEKGGAWWRRFFEEGLETPADYLVKLDPDARVLRPFVGPPPFPICGSVENPGKANENVQGGCQVIERGAAEKILGSPLLDSPCLRSESSFVKDDASRRWVRSQAYLSTDHTLGWLARNLGIPWGNWSEVGSKWKPPAPTGDYAVTHPHKLESDGVNRDTPLRVITTCKGRLEHLKVTLPRWVAEPGVSVTVVDYECPDGTVDWVRGNFPQVDVVKVRGVPNFHLSRARNVGARHSPAGWWCFWDADLLCEPGWAKAVRRSIRRNRYLLASPIAWSQFGSVVVHSESFHSVHGYDELIRGWGAEDGDFYARLRHSGVRPGSFPGRYISSIPHSDEDRTKHYEVKSKPDSQRLNEVYLRLKTAFMATAGRLPNSDERAGFLAEAYEVVALPIPGWFYDPASESPLTVELLRGISVPNAPAPSKSGLPEGTPGVPDAGSPSSALLAQGESSVTIKRLRDHQTGAPIINISVLVQNVSSGDASQIQPCTKTSVL